MSRRSYWKVLVATGCRISKALGLRWTDVDLDAGAASFTHQLQRQGTRHVLTRLKSKSNRRIVPLAPEVVEMLRGHLDRQTDDPTSEDPEYATWDLIFRSETGGPVHRTTATNLLKKLTGRANLPVLESHDLRRGYATLTIADGTDPKSVQELLGRGSLKPTLEVYTRAVSARKREAGNRMGRLIATSGAGVRAGVRGSDAPTK